MQFKVIFSALATTALLAAASNASSANLIANGDFSTGSISPWRDWTGAGASVQLSSDPSIGHYASLPHGTDLFQTISPLSNGIYELKFKVQNQSSWDARLVYAVQQSLGINPDRLYSMGLLENTLLPANGGWTTEDFVFTLNNPGFLVNELTFSNSYDCTCTAVTAGSNNPNGTIINVANVSLTTYSGAGPTSPPAAPEPAIWSLMILSVGAIGIALRTRRETVPS